MHYEITSHMHAEAVLRGDFASEFEELLQVFATTTVPLRAPIDYSPPQRGGPLKRQERKLGGRKAKLLLPIDHAALNKNLDSRLREQGWNRQPFVDELRADRKLGSALKGDFAKRGIFVEVEFGNTASMFRDLFKFHMAGRTGDAQVAILAVAKQTMAFFFDSGVSTFEAATRLLPYLHIGVQIPVCIVGLEPDDWGAVRSAYEGMRNLCEMNGEDCHSIETAVQASGYEETDENEGRFDDELDPDDDMT